MNARHVLGMAVALVLGVASAAANADTIADWTFETTAPVTGGPLNPELGSGSATGHHASGAAVYSSPAGNGSSHSFSSNTWAPGDYYQFQVNTTGFSNIVLNWDQISSSTGPGNFEFEYSTDGVNFSAPEEYTVLASGSPGAAAWSATTHSTTTSFSEDLSITAANNDATLYFRLIDENTTASGGGTVGTAGTDRVDNVVVTGVSAVPLPAAVWLFGSGLLGLAGLRPSRKQMTEG